MVMVDLSIDTIAVLVSGLYCVANDVDALAIPQSVWIAVAEKLEYFLSNELWDFEVIGFEEWVRTGLSILPKVLLTDEDIELMKKSCIYWEYPNGNMILVISMDISSINGVD
ncbi:MAG: hypothetical protein J6Y78_04530 [Paludibacteraceae bacterium]|nr:hypothetical protein [Paludibacteraceae bacterium]